MARSTLEADRSVVGVDNELGDAQAQAASLGPSGQSPIDLDETVEIITFLDAAWRSRQQGCEVVALGG